MNSAQGVPERKFENAEEGTLIQRELFPSFSLSLSLNCPKSHDKSWWNQAMSLKPVSDSVCLSVREEEGFSLSSLQIWKVSLNPQSFHRSHLSLACCKIQLTCAFRNDNSQTSDLVHFLHYQPHLFLCQFERRDFWIFFFLISAKFPTLHLYGKKGYWDFWRWENKWLHPQVIFFSISYNKSYQYLPTCVIGMVVICYACCILNSMEGWEAGEVGSYLTVSRNSGNVAVNILLGGPHSLGGTDDCIHGNKTHDGIYGEKKNKPSTIYVPQGRGEEGEMRWMEKVGCKHIYHYM